MEGGEDRASRHSCGATVPSNHATWPTIYSDESRRRSGTRTITTHLIGTDWNLDSGHRKSTNRRIGARKKRAHRFRRPCRVASLALAVWGIQRFSGVTGCFVRRRGKFTSYKAAEPKKIWNHAAGHEMLGGSGDNLW